MYSRLSRIHVLIAVIFFVAITPSCFGGSSSRTRAGSYTKKTIPASTFREVGSVNIFVDLDKPALGIVGKINGPGPVVVEVLDSKVLDSGVMAYKIRYQGKVGWVSSRLFE
jgi:hypothetical protein